MPSGTRLARSRGYIHTTALYLLCNLINLTVVAVKHVRQTLIVLIYFLLVVLIVVVLSIRGCCRRSSDVACSRRCGGRCCRASRVRRHRVFCLARSVLLLLCRKLGERRFHRLGAQHQACVPVVLEFQTELLRGARGVPLCLACLALQVLQRIVGQFPSRASLSRTISFNLAVTASDRVNVSRISGFAQ